jgi:hypothetical protein
MPIIARCREMPRMNLKKAAQAGIGSVALIESTVMVTTRHSDSAPNASEAATASINRGDATGARWL